MQDFERKRLLAQMLMGQGQQQDGQMVGRFYVAPSAGSRLASLGSALAGAHLHKGADQAEQAQQDEKRAALAKSLSELHGGAGPRVGADPRQQAALGALSRGPMEDLQGAVSSASQQALNPKRPELIKVGQGDSLYDPSQGQVVHQGQEKPGRLVAVLGPDGKPTYVRENEAEGMTPHSRSAVTVNNNQNPKPPTGYMWNEAGDGLVAIPGGPADESAKTDARQQEAQFKGDIMLQEIGRAFAILDDPSNIIPETGVIGDMAKHIGGTDAHALNKRLNTIRSNIGFAELQKMREASPTGGALGQVSNFEVGQLQSLLGAVEQSENDADLRYNLARLANYYTEVVHGKPGQGGPQPPYDLEAMLAERHQQQSAPQQAGGPQVGTVEDGYEYVGGDPSSPNSWRKAR